MKRPKRLHSPNITAPARFISKVSCVERNNFIKVINNISNITTTYKVVFNTLTMFKISNACQVITINYVIVYLLLKQIKSCTCLQGAKGRARNGWTSNSWNCNKPTVLVYSNFSCYYWMGWLLNLPRISCNTLPIF